MATDPESMKIDVTLKDILGEEKKLSSIKSLTTFISNELAFWQEVRNKFRFEPLNQVLNLINSAMTEINNFKANYGQWNEDQINNSTFAAA